MRIEVKLGLSKLVGSKLQSVGSLPFPFTRGGCGNVADLRIYLCFSASGPDGRPEKFKECHYSEQPLGEFDDGQKFASNFEHHYIRLGASTSKLKHIICN